ncbi:MAG: hypothetical protein ACUZ8I_17260, partial [Candidatus Scalindua sp.]
LSEKSIRIQINSVTIIYKITLEALESNGGVVTNEYGKVFMFTFVRVTRRNHMVLVIEAEKIALQYLFTSIDSSSKEPEQKERRI